MDTPPSALTKVLLEELEASVLDWDVDELGFLAATSKVEQPFRDRLAWRLQQRAHASLLVSREWKRADLALLAQGGPLALIEAKALYSFDVLQPAVLTGYLSRISADLDKARALAPAAAHYALVLVTHVDRPVSTELLEVVKYASGINRAHAAPGSHSMAEQARNKLRVHLAELGSVHRVELEIGIFQGLPVSVDAFLVDAAPEQSARTAVPGEAALAGQPTGASGYPVEDVSALFRQAKPSPDYEPHPVSNTRAISRWVTPFYVNLIEWEAAQLRGDDRAAFVRDASAALPWFSTGVADELYGIPDWRTALMASFFLLLEPDVEGAVGRAARRAARRGWGHGLGMYLLALAVRDEVEVLEEVFTLEPDSRPWVLAATTVGGYRCHPLLSELLAGGERLDDDLARKARDVLDLVREVQAAARSGPSG